MSVTATETISSSHTSPHIRELTPGFGVEVEGLDFTGGVTNESYRLIEELVKKVNKFQASITQPLMYSSSTA